jgi:hypothetical protein
VGTKSIIVAERSSLEGTRGRLDTCVIVVELQIQTRTMKMNHGCIQRRREVRGRITFAHVGCLEKMRSSDAFFLIFATG